MLILIAESKTMTPCDAPVTAAQLLDHTPALQQRAAAIMQSFATLPAAEIAVKVKISPTLAQRMCRMAYEFPNRSAGGRAIESFTGVVFKAFDCRSLSPDAAVRAKHSVRIISSLYGWLRPDDIVKPYRLEFTAPVAPDGEVLASWWRDAVTDLLLDELRSGGHDTVLNLLPADAARCIDWSRVAAEATILKAEFLELQPGGGVRRPNSNRLKTLRGLLLRHIIKAGLDTPAELRSVATDTLSAADPAEDIPAGTLLYYA